MHASRMQEHHSAMLHIAVFMLCCLICASYVLYFFFCSMLTMLISKPDLAIYEQVLCGRSWAVLGRLRVVLGESSGLSGRPWATPGVSVGGPGGGAPLGRLAADPIPATVLRARRHGAAMTRPPCREVHDWDTLSLAPPCRSILRREATECP